MRAAGVNKKLLPMYTDLSWRDMQGLDGGFVSKVMSHLEPRRNPKRKPARRKPRALAKRTPRKTAKKRNTSTTPLGKKIRELISQGLSPAEALKAAKRIFRSGHTKPGSYKRAGRYGRRNPGGINAPATLMPCFTAAARKKWSR